MKTDEQIRELVVAAIRRHSMDVETWAHTHLWSDTAPERQHDLLRQAHLDAGELPILSSSPGPTEWTFITTRRIWSSHRGHVRSLAVREIGQQHYGNFKGHSGQAVEQMTITSLDEAVLQCPYETGKASMGVISAVGTLTRLRHQP